MREEISVDKAIIRGHIIVNVPVIISLVGVPALAYHLSNENVIPQWGIVVGFVVGFVLAWFIWSLMITKWRLWAFDNVRNVHELNKRAIQEKLIWNDGNIFEKTEIRTREDQQQLKKIERKFARDDVYREDYSLPPKTEIYYSKGTSYFELAASLLAMGVGLYMYTHANTQSYVLGTIMICIGVYGIIKESRRAFNPTPQMVIDNKGLTTKKVGYREWAAIEGEEVVQEGYGQSAKSYLTYFYDGNQFEKVTIDALNVSHKELENIIRTYRMRHGKNLR